MSDHVNLSLPCKRFLAGVIFGTVLIVLAPESTWAETLSIDIGDRSYNITYAAVNMTIDDAVVDSLYSSLIFDVTTFGDGGVLDVTLERLFLDSIMDGEDHQYYVAIDDLPSTVTEETTTDQLRVLSVEVPTGSRTIEIIGTVLAKDILEPTEPIPDTPLDSAEPTIPDTPLDPVIAEPLEPTEPIPDTPLDPVIAEPLEPTEPIPDTPLDSAEPTIPDTPLDPVIAKETPIPPDTSSVDNCGPGTILEGDTCVLEPPKQTAMERMNVFTSTVIAFIVAGGIAVALALIAKASKRR